MAIETDYLFSGGFGTVGANLIWRNIKMDTLEIMEYFTAENRKHWLEEIGRCEWGAGKYLHRSYGAL